MIGFPSAEVRVQLALAVREPASVWPRVTLDGIAIEPVVGVHGGVTVKLVGGPLNGKSAVAYGAIVGSLLDVNRSKYRVTKVDSIPGWNEQIASATFVDHVPMVPKVVVAKPLAIKPK